MINRKQSSKKMASLASSVLTDSSTSQIQKTLAGSVLSQTGSSNQTGDKLEQVASSVMKSDKYNDTTKSLAASILSQSNKAR
tara:strand:- start:366 stop:611 length:246 start_codon:yes stop_codon:yes gene_type:complete